MAKRTVAYEFFGEPNRRPGQPHPDSPRRSEPYIASTNLLRAVNLAIFLERPLLLEGEAGAGKTRLARAVAYELGLPFYPWYVRSTSKTQEGLYTYDAIGRLHDAHVRPFEAETNGAKPNPARRDPQKPTDYRRLEALGKAFKMRKRPAVVLIDEIDKADVDFPNDLLAILDDPWGFDIPETGESVNAAENCRPIVIITSNKEKGNLPAPFLRRCIYYALEFPSPDELKLIVAAHYADSDTSPDESLIGTATRRFVQLREEGGLHKRPGTSEFLDWLRALHSFKSPVGAPLALGETGDLPYPELLFKLRADWLQRTSR